MPALVMVESALLVSLQAGEGRWGTRLWWVWQRASLVAQMVSLVAQMVSLGAQMTPGGAQMTPGGAQMASLVVQMTPVVTQVVTSSSASVVTCQQQALLSLVPVEAQLQHRSSVSLVQQQLMLLTLKAPQ